MSISVTPARMQLSFQNYSFLVAYICKVAYFTSTYTYKNQLKSIKLDSPWQRLAETLENKYA